jgi:hypothetical protein
MCYLVGSHVTDFTAQSLHVSNLQRNVMCTHRSYITRSKTHWYRVANKDFTAIYLWSPVLRQLRRDNATLRPNTCTNSCNESSGRSIGIAASYYFHCMYEICFITLLITNTCPSLLRSSGWIYKSTKNTIICDMEYREPPKVIINVSNIGYFNLFLLLF